MVALAGAAQEAMWLQKLNSDLLGKILAGMCEYSD